MKSLMIIVIIFVFCSNLIAQDILRKKNFGLTTADDFGRSVIETSDGNIVIMLLGYTSSKS